MSCFFDAGDAEIEGQNIDDGLAAAGHDAGSSSCVGIGAGHFQDVLHDDKTAAAGNGPETDEWQQLRRYAQQLKEWVQNPVYQVQKTGGGKTVDGKENADQERKNVQGGLQPFFLRPG